MPTAASWLSIPLSHIGSPSLSCLIRCANMKWIRWYLLKIQSGHEFVHRRTDGQGDTSIPLFQLRWSGGYNYTRNITIWRQLLKTSNKHSSYYYQIQMRWPDINLNVKNGTFKSIFRYHYTEWTLIRDNYISEELFSSDYAYSSFTTRDKFSLWCQHATSICCQNGNYLSTCYESYKATYMGNSMSGLFRGNSYLIRITKIMNIQWYLIRNWPVLISFSILWLLMIWYWARPSTSTTTLSCEVFGYYYVYKRIWKSYSHKSMSLCFI